VSVLSRRSALQSGYTAAAISLPGAWWGVSRRPKGDPSDRFGRDWFNKFEGHAEVSAAHLEAWARGAGQRDLKAPEVLQVLMAWHRHASPPSGGEQPRMSLKERWDNHDFLSTPIHRQALTVVVPEYFQVAPVLAKLVRPGHHALAQGSLLQCFAITGGSWRIRSNGRY